MNTFMMLFCMGCIVFGCIAILVTVQAWLFPPYTEEERRRMIGYARLSEGGHIRRMK